VASAQGESAGGRRRGKRGLALGAFVGAAVAAVIAFLVVHWRSSGVTEGGPLACADCSAGASIPVAVGKRATFGAANLENHGNEAAVLERVEYVDLTPGVRILGPVVSRSGESRGSGIGLVLGYPPPQLKGAFHELSGYRVLPLRSFDDEVDVLVGLSPSREGMFSYRKLRIYYHVGSKHYVTTYDMGVRVCAPPSTWRSRCLPPGP